MVFFFRRLSMLLVFWMAFAAPAALADAAPEQLYPGSNIATPVPTQVQMASERVVLELIKDQSLAQSESDGQGWLVKVQADFQMKAGPKAEKMTVRFPLEDVQGGTSSPSLLARNLRAYVNGQAVKTRLVTSKTVDGETIDWAGFDVIFSAGKTTELRVTYTALPVLEYERFMVLGYILETGAGWAGRIGQADFVVRLPLAANNRLANIPVDLLGIDRIPGVTFAGNEVRWTLRDFEPTAKHNVQLAIFDPVLIAEWQKARAAAQWGTLASLKRYARFSGLMVATNPYAWRAFQADPGYPEFDRALSALEKLAATEPQARAAVVEVLSQLPTRWPLYSVQSPQLLRALRQLEAMPANTHTMSLFAALQSMVDGPAVLPRARAAQSQVTPEETVKSMAQLTGLRPYPGKNCPDLPARENREAQKGYSFRTSEPAAIAAMSLNSALLKLGRAWLQTAPEDSLSTWQITGNGKALTLWSNSFSSLNGQRRFTVEIRPLYDGSEVCFRFYRDAHMFTM